MVEHHSVRLPADARLCVAAKPGDYRQLVGKQPFSVNLIYIHDFLKSPVQLFEQMPDSAHARFFKAILNAIQW